MADEIKILDLDAIIPDERKIKINGKEYRIRGDATVEESLKLTKYANDNSSPEAIAALFGAIKSFFIDKIDGIFPIKELVNIVAFKPFRKEGHNHISSNCHVLKYQASPGNFQAGILNIDFRQGCILAAVPG